MAIDRDRPRKLIESLDLQPHPEGGYFGEIFRSQQKVSTLGSVGSEGSEVHVERDAISTIYFLLIHPEFSCWHVVTWDFDVDQHPVLVVPAGHWQAARPIDGFTLAGCTVSPGFEFSDMRLLREDDGIAARIRGSFPEAADLL